MEDVLQFRYSHRVKCETVNYERFCNVTDTWIRRPQVVNRKLAGAVITKRFLISSARVNDVKSIVLSGDDDDENCSNDDSVCCIVRKLLPRAQHISSVSEVIIRDDRKHSLTFLPLEDSRGVFPYCLQLCTQTSELVLGWCNCVEQPCCHQNNSTIDNLVPVSELHTLDHILEPTCGINLITLPWLVHILLPKLVTWAQSWDEGKTKRQPLIPLERYIQLYQAMKKKYAGPLIEVGVPCY